MVPRHCSHYLLRSMPAARSFISMPVRISYAVFFFASNTGQVHITLRIPFLSPWGLKSSAKVAQINLVMEID